MSEPVEPRLNADGSGRRAIPELMEFSGNDVLEIGGGNGRVTYSHADSAASGLAVDPRTSVEVRLAGCSVVPIAARRLRPEQEITSEFFAQYARDVIFVPERSVFRGRA